MKELTIDSPTIAIWYKVKDSCFGGDFYINKVEVVKETNTLLYIKYPLEDNNFPIYYGVDVPKYIKKTKKHECEDVYFKSLDEAKSYLINRVNSSIAYFEQELDALKKFKYNVRFLNGEDKVLVKMKKY